MGSPIRCVRFSRLRESATRSPSTQLCVVSSHNNLECAIPLRQPSLQSPSVQPRKRDKSTSAPNTSDNPAALSSNIIGSAILRLGNNRHSCSVRRSSEIRDCLRRRHLPTNQGNSMSIFGSIMSKIFHTGTATAASDTQAAAAAPAAGASAAGASTAAAPGGAVDVEAVLTQMASQKGGGGNWQTSIVDLLKLLDLDSSWTRARNSPTNWSCMRVPTARRNRTSPCTRPSCRNLRKMAERFRTASGAEPTGGPPSRADPEGTAVGRDSRLHVPIAERDLLYCKLWPPSWSSTAVAGPAKARRSSHHLPLQEPKRRHRPPAARQFRSLDRLHRIAGTGCFDVRRKCA